MGTKLLAEEDATVKLLPYWYLTWKNTQKKDKETSQEWKNWASQISHFLTWNMPLAKWNWVKNFTPISKPLVVIQQAVAGLQQASKVWQLSTHHGVNVDHAHHAISNSFALIDDILAVTNGGRKDKFQEWQISREFGNVETFRWSAWICIGVILWLRK